MNSGNNFNNNPQPQPQPQQRNLSRNRRYTQPPLGHERGAFAVRGVDGGSQSVSSDIHDDVTLLEPQDSTAQPPIPPRRRRRGGGPSTAAAAATSSSTQQHNPGEEEEPSAVIAHASVVDEQAEAERERLLLERTAQLDELRREREAERQRQIQMERRQLELEEQQTELQAARLRERRRVLELEEELGRVRSSSAAGGATMLRAFVERVVPRREEEEKQEVEDPVPTPHQDHQDGPHETPQDLEGQPEGVRPISVRPVDHDTTLDGLDSTGASARLQMNGDNYGNEDESIDSSSNNNKRQGGSSSSSSNTRPRLRILAAVGILVLVVVAVIVAEVTGGMSSGGSSSKTDPAHLPAPPDTTDPTIPPTAPPTRHPTPPDTTTTTTTTEPTTVLPPLPEISVSWKQLGADLNGVAAGDLFGESIALSADGTILAVGARYNDANGSNSGQVRVFAYDTTTASGGRWKQLGAVLNGAAAYDLFGDSVALSADGTILAVGADGNDANGSASGHVRVFSYSKENNRWKQLGADLNGEASYDRFGYSVALSSDGTILAVGAYGNDGSGQVRVFQYGKAKGRWIQLGDFLDGEAGSHESGRSVALSEDGTILAAGGYNARVFRYNAASHHWYQLGADFDGKAAGRGSVALSDSGFILAIGGPPNDANGNGHVRVFEYSTASNKWKQLGGDLGGKVAGDRFGWSAALSALSSDGTVMVVGANYNDDNGSNPGHARIFQYDKANEQWNQLGEDLNGKAAGDEFGIALSADGTIVASGAIWNDNNGGSSGQVRVFQRNNKSGDP